MIPLEILCTELISLLALGTPIGLWATGVHRLHLAQKLREWEFNLSSKSRKSGELGCSSKVRSIVVADPVLI